MAANQFRTKRFYPANPKIVTVEDRHEYSFVAKDGAYQVSDYAQRQSHHYVKSQCNPVASFSLGVVSGRYFGLSFSILRTYHSVLQTKRLHGS